LDGFDELPADGQKTVCDFLKTLLQAHPDTRVVATALPERMDGLLGLGFAPLALMGWDAHRQTEFIRKWGERWKRFLESEAWAQMTQDPIDPILLEAWLGYGNQYLTPFELTLKIWSGFAGDSLGPHIQDAIAAHIRRVAPPDTPAAALETLAMQATLNARCVRSNRRRKSPPKGRPPPRARRRTLVLVRSARKKKRARSRLRPAACSEKCPKADCCSHIRTASCASCIRFSADTSPGAP
ncbi:MAG: hypothetical protein DWB59_13145, partial [Anaerolineae bacterium]|nr:hypothetical protein [Anaerolineae bacterium]